MFLLFTVFDQFSVFLLNKSILRYKNVTNTKLLNGSVGIFDWLPFSDSDGKYGFAAQTCNLINLLNENNFMTSLIAFIH